MNLFIIGNGFDLAHGLKTAYINFREYLEDEDEEFLCALEGMYGLCSDSSRAFLEKYLWTEFEKQLSDINDAEIIVIGTLTKWGG